MKLSLSYLPIPHAFRFTFIAISGLLFVGSNSAWNALGYLNPYAWFLEWGGVILAFICVYMATRTRPVRNYTFSYLIISASLLMSTLSFLPQVSGSLIQTIDPFSFYIYSLPLLAVPVFVLTYGKTLGSRRWLSFAFFAVVLGTIMYITYRFYAGAPAFPTDESVFDMYAVHLFLQGLNPYNPGLWSGAFSYYNFPFGPFDPITPLTTGGYVHSLTYPALSFLVFIPAVLLKVKASLIMLPLFAVPMFLAWYRAWSRKQWLYSGLVLLPFLSLVVYTYQGSSADTDILWASLLMLSYMVLPKHKLSGALFGLSLSVKQLPLLAAPFLLYYVFREYGSRKAMLWLATMIGAFLFINGYFILLSPGDYFSALLANEFAPLIGIGYGPAQLSFLGILSIPKLFFTVVMVDLMVLFFALYVLKYERMKYALFAFPIIIFFFNYRLFVQYIFFWAVFSLIPMLDIILSEDALKEKISDPVTRVRRIRRNYTKVAVAIVAIVIISSGILIYHESVQEQPANLRVNSVSLTGFNSTGYADAMTVSITLFHGSANISGLNFRVVPTGAIVNGNMLFWEPVKAVTVLPGQTVAIMLEPQYPQYSLPPKEPFMVVAYYSNLQGNYYYFSK